MGKVTKGSIEAAIAEAIVHFQREQQGRGPAEVRVHVITDTVIVRATGILTPTETRLATTDEGRKLVRNARLELRNIVHEQSEALVCRATQCKVLRSYGDMNVEASEQIDVYILEADLERRLLRQELDNLNGLGGRRTA